MEATTPSRENNKNNNQPRAAGAPRSLSFNARLTMLIGAVMLLVVVLAMLALAQLRGVAATIDSIYKDRLVPMQQLRLVSQGFTVDVMSSAQRLAEGRLAVLQADVELAAIEQKVRSNWQDYRATFLVERERVLIAAAEPQLGRGLQLVQRLRELSRTADEAELRRFMAQQLQPAVAAIAKVMTELIDVQLDVGRSSAAAVQDEFFAAAWMVLGLVLLAALLSVGVGWSLWQLRTRERSVAQAQRERLQNHYHALSQTNQMIVRSPGSAQRLFEGLCRICVETGHAALATVVLREGEQFERVAAAGPVERLLPGVPERWRADSSFGAASMSTEVWRTGQVVLSNRALSDPRRRDWRAGVIPPGVEAMAAFPLRRGGQVIGALSLLASEEDFFDEQLVALLSEMAGDVSFALDNLDRDQARRQALLQAEAERALFHRVFNNTAIACAVTNLDDGRIVEINEMLCQRYGLTREQLLGQRFSDFSVGLSSEDRRNFYDLMRRRGKVRNMEAAVRTQDGSQRYSLVNGDLIDYRGQRCVLSSSLDITEVRALREQQQQQQQQPLA